MTNTFPAILKMPDRFLWGVATAAHQNEGHNHNNQWAAWEQQPNRIYGGARAGAATGWWGAAGGGAGGGGAGAGLETAAADFDRAAELGLNSLRLSVEWSRIEPAEGVFDQTALRRYAEMIGLLRARGLEPMVTLHHFTDPLWLTEKGAWENPLSEDYFSRFVERVVDALGDQVQLWCTINEPIVYAYIGFLEGFFPPGAKSLPRALKVLRRMLLAHGRAYRTIHRVQSAARVGLAHNMRVYLPADPASQADRRAAALMDRISNRTVLDAITTGRLLAPIGLGATATFLLDSCDYIGVNYYTPIRTSFDPTRPGLFFARTFFDPDAELSDTVPGTAEAYGEIAPTGLYLALKQLAPYGKPIYVTENGVPDHDDDVRPRFITTHLAEAWRAINEGVDLRGYYHWTLVDNFEWAAGWDLQFGLFGLDRETGQRTSKASAAVYGRIAQANGVPRDLLEQVAPAAVGTYFGGG